METTETVQSGDKVDRSSLSDITLMLKSLPASQWVDVGEFFHPESFDPRWGGRCGRHGYAVFFEGICYSVGVERESGLSVYLQRPCWVDHWYLSRGMEDLLVETLPPRFQFDDWGLWSRDMGLCEQLYWSIREHRESDRRDFLTCAGIKRSYTD